MSDKNTGGPAFPNDAGFLAVDRQGMTLRDYFAAKAVQGLLASDVNAPIDQFAALSYQVADEMLKARES